MRLPETYQTRMKAQLGEDFPHYLEAMQQESRRALRVNTLKTDIEAVLESIPGLVTTGLTPESFLVPASLKPKCDPLHLAGLYYMQEPSAQYPVTLGRTLTDIDCPVVLDLCAAPGGKSTQLAALMGNRGLLIANEPVPTRTAILQGNLERLGVTNALVTCMLPENLCPQLTESCDLVLVDAPCSGEGMFRKDQQAIRDWSVEHVHASALRQSAILSTAAVCVKPGGMLIYSTCTFSPEEDEGVVEGFLREHPDFHLEGMHRLYPHTCCGEGQFAACLVREGERADESPLICTPRAQSVPAYADFAADAFRVPLPNVPQLLEDGRLMLMPERIPVKIKNLRVKSCGIPAGEVIKNRFVPAHALFLACKKGQLQHTLELDDAAFSAYLAGETLPCPAALKGFVAVTVDEYPIGFGKAVSGVLKNHYPKGLRLR